MQIVFMLHNTQSYPLVTRGYPSIFSKTCIFNRTFKLCSLQLNNKEANQLQKQLHFIAYSYCTCSYTTCVVWQTKCKFVMCISHVLCVFTGPHEDAKIMCNSAYTCQVLNALNMQARACIYMCE